MKDKNNESGFEKVEESKFNKPCPSPNHNPPGHLYVPPGTRYRHVCSFCGQVRYVEANTPVSL